MSGSFLTGPPAKRCKSAKRGKEGDFFDRSELFLRSHGPRLRPCYRRKKSFTLPFIPPVEEGKREGCFLGVTSTQLRVNSAKQSRFTMAGIASSLALLAMTEKKAPRNDFQ